MCVGIDSSVDIVLENGKLAELSYLPYDTTPIKIGLKINVFDKDGIVYTLDNTYQVIDYSDPEASGFSAILLKNIDTGEYVVSFRGTQEPFVDWAGAGNGVWKRGQSRFLWVS